VQGRGSPTEP
jgi:hypothetical protein